MAIATSGYMAVIIDFSGLVATRFQKLSPMLWSVSKPAARLTARATGTGSYRAVDPAGLREALRQAAEE